MISERIHDFFPASELTINVIIGDRNFLAYVDRNPIDLLGQQGTAISLLVVHADLPPGTAHGSRVTAGYRVYEITGIAPDATGLTRLNLEELWSVGYRYFKLLKPLESGQLVWSIGQIVMLSDSMREIEGLVSSGYLLPLE